MSKSAYRLEMPREWTSGVIFASPHSGCDYTPEFLERTPLNSSQIRSSEDAFVDQLFSAAPRFGAPLLSAVAPRAYVDLNRSADELDPAIIEGVRKQGSNPRISSGLGVIPRVVANGHPIYSGKISMREALSRLDDVWFPYHERLSHLLSRCHEQFGQAILIDCHSMPHEALGNSSRRDRPDIVLGDRFGASSDQEIVETIEASFAATGLTVARNTPFAGAYTTQTYGRPSRGHHVVQIEIDRSLYMDEVRIEPREDFAVLQQAITHVIAEITGFARGRMPMAAE